MTEAVPLKVAQRAVPCINFMDGMVEAEVMPLELLRGAVLPVNHLVRAAAAETLAMNVVMKAEP